MKEIMRFLIVSFIALSILGSGISSASAATVTVADGLNNTEIQTIIDGAQSGDTVKFLGSYYENIALVINKTLSLAAADNGTVIKAISNSSLIPSTVKNITTYTAAFYFVDNSTSPKNNGSSISGFNISSMSNSTSNNSYTNSLIYGSYASGLKIYNNVLNSSSWGINLNYCPNATINNNTVGNMTTTGIFAFGSPTVVIANNTVLNCSNHGIDVRHGSSYNATIYGNLIDGASEGIYLMHSAGHNVYNNTVKNCALSSITVYGAGNLLLTNNTLNNSFVGFLLSSGYYNVTIQNNTYALKSLPFPPTFSYYVLTGDSSTNKAGSSGTFSDSSKLVSDVALTSSYSNSSINNGKSTTYTVKVSNNGNSSANNITIKNIAPSSDYTNYQVTGVSRGSFDASNGTWKIDSLSSGSDAMIVFTVTAKKAGSTSNTPSADYKDNGGNKTVNTSSNSLQINKDIKLSNSYSVSKTSAKKNSYFIVTVKIKNSGLDTSDNITVQDKLSTAFKRIATTQSSSFKFISGKWIGTVGAGKTATLKMKVEVVKKGKFNLPIFINGKQTKNYIIKGY